MGEAVLTLVVPFALAVVGFVVRGRWRGRRAGRQLERLEESGRATLRCRVRGDAPYPSRWAHARLLLAPDGAVLRFRERHLPDVQLPAGRLEVVHVRVAGSGDRVRQDTDDLVVVSTADAAGGRLHLLVDEESVEGVLEVLERTAAWGGPPTATAGPVALSWRAAVPTWSVATTAAGLLLTVAIVAMWAGSEPVPVRLTGPADVDLLCPATWTDPWDGSRQRAQISCEEEQAGDTVPGLALPAPFRGEIFDTDSFPALLVFLPGALLLSAAFGVARQAWRLRDDRRSSPATPTGLDSGSGPAALPALPPVDAERLDPDTVGEIAAARQARERWVPAAGPAITPEAAESAPWWTVGPLRMVVRREAARCTPALLVLLFAVLGGWTAWSGWSGTRGEVQVAPATAVEVISTVPFMPDDLDITFVGPEGQVSTLVALVGDVPEDDLMVAYSVDNPQAARLLGEADGTRRGMVVSGLAAAAALLWVTWCLRSAARTRRRVLGALHDEHRQQLEYVLSADPEGDPVLLLWPPQAEAPGWAVFLAEPVLGAIPVRGTVQVRGVPGDDAAVMPVLPGRVLWPASPAVRLDAELSIILITGAVPEELPDGNDDDHAAA